MVERLFRVECREAESHLAQANGLPPASNNSGPNRLYTPSRRLLGKQGGVGLS